MLQLVVHEVILDSSAILTKGEPSMTITGYVPDS